MSDLKLNVVPGKTVDLFNGTYLVLFHANRIPPHLMLSIDGLTYSISVKGQFPEEPLYTILEYIKRKTVSCIFVEWKLPIGVNSDDLRLIAGNNIRKYEKVESGKTSCLFPLRDTISEIMGESFRTANFIFELIPMMKDSDLIGKVYSLNMEGVHEFEMITYTEAELSEAIRIAAQH